MLSLTTVFLYLDIENPLLIVKWCIPVKRRVHTAIKYIVGAGKFICKKEEMWPLYKISNCEGVDC